MPNKILLLIVIALLCADARAADEQPWKLTLGEYFFGSTTASDVNLRWQRSDTHVWVGGYHDNDFGSQARAGFDTAIDIVDHVQLQPSVQVATRGFIGGSLNVQAGDAWFGLAGIGRTNLRPYYNLNFDPNDAIELGAGHRTDDGSLYTLFVVADDRLHTRQRDWHLNARLPLDRNRITLDLLRKSGESDAGYIKAWGFSATYDWPGWFLKLAYDPYQNFSTQDEWRFSTGLRF
jgi:hypothetical protein